MMSDSRVRPEGELFAVQPDVRRLVDLINHLLNENRLLRDEIEARRALSDDATVVAKASVLEEMIGRATVSAHQEIAGTPGQTDAPPRHDSNGTVRKAPVRVGNLAWQLRSPARPDAAPGVDEAISQLEDLRIEVRQLRDDVRQIQRLQPLSPAKSSASAPSISSPRLEPIRLSRSEPSLQSDSHLGMWMKLRHPWFYVPLAWITAFGVVALAGFIVFFT